MIKFSIKNFSIFFHNLNAMGERNQENETILLARSAAMASNSCKIFNLD